MVVACIKLHMRVGLQREPNHLPQRLILRQKTRVFEAQQIRWDEASPNIAGTRGRLIFMAG